MTIPNYDAHEDARRQAGVSFRANFRNEMQPTIHVQLQVRSIVAKSYEGARVMAYRCLHDDSTTLDALQKMGMETITKFSLAARVAKEVDGSYTVTIP